MSLYDCLSVYGMFMCSALSHPDGNPNIASIDSGIITTHASSATVGSSKRHNVDWLHRNQQCNSPMVDIIEKYPYART